MRESGFDPTGRFGPFGADVTRYAPVCLNTLLYLMELDLAEIDAALGTAAAAMRARATERRMRIESVLWDETAGLYFDYDAARDSRNPYPFATTFWPLWAGIASPAHARRVRDNLRLLERPGGIVTSTRVTGAQWDAPFGWAPLQLFAVRGLRRYGFDADADRSRAPGFRCWSRTSSAAARWSRSTTSTAHVRHRGRLAFGYTSNEIGFGWTNGVALELLADLH